jgi:hypothetical protein
MPMPMPRVSPLTRKELKPWTGPAADFALGAPFFSGSASSCQADSGRRAVDFAARRAFSVIGFTGVRSLAETHDASTSLVLWDPTRRLRVVARSPSCAKS